ncbi:hypothetical protein OG302_43130 [Streptomyces sp. NBC_01283]|uniref:hypothetical protein n=1 Tax=Streptomyces sp. NBC_01283 TaxID=2903812 RepID=UPI00352EAC59|nr:hypothetical protein OG302_43130 [Streptomyces sp. NBC_01283]
MTGTASPIPGQLGLRRHSRTLLPGLADEPMAQPSLGTALLVIGRRLGLFDHRAVLGWPDLVRYPRTAEAAARLDPPRRATRVREGMHRCGDVLGPGQSAATAPSPHPPDALHTPQMPATETPP